MANLNSDSARRIVLHSMAVVGNGMARQPMPLVKIKPLNLAPGGKIEAYLLAQRTGAFVGGAQAISPGGSEVGNCFKGYNLGIPSSGLLAEFHSAEVQAVEGGARHCSNDAERAILVPIWGMHQTKVGHAGVIFADQPH